MIKFLLISFLLLFTTVIKVSAQSCFNVAAGNDTTISCLQPCLNLKARIPDVRTSENYQVIPIPYNPYPFVTLAPPYVLPCIIDQDDKYGDVATLPFNFCFFGSIYTQYVLGTNGIITFDLSNALMGNNYQVTNPLPFIGSGTPDYACPAPPFPIGTLYPRLAIMGTYRDLIPDLSDPTYKIEARVEGSAPCRRFVMSYSNVKIYDCPSLKATFEVVLHEGTGLIDIFIENNPSCAATNSIIGIQKDGLPATPFATPPGRNLFTQQVTNEGWRFIPSGATSLLDSVALYKNGAWISGGTAVPLGNGELEVTFANICQTEDSMSYVVRAFYQQCDNPAVQTEGSDTIIVYKTLSPVTTAITNIKCNGAGNGIITVTAPLNAALEYSIDGTNWQTATVFNVPAGNYIVQARVIGSLCGSSGNATVTEPPVFTVSATSENANCTGNNGSITITATGGTPGYVYSNDSGTTYQSSNQFLNLAPGNYNLVVKDTNSCLQPLTQTVTFIDTMYLDLGADSTICAGNSITLIPQTNALTDTFKWTPAATLNYDTARTPIATPTDTTKYFLIAKWGICQRTDSITVNVLHKPVPFAGRDTTICYKTNALLHGSATNLSGTVNYAWSPPDSLNTPNVAITIARMDTTRQFTLTVTDNYGCNFTVTDSMMVFMQPPLVVFAGNDTNAILGRPHQLMASGGVNFVWSPAGPLNNPFIANPLATIFNDTYFHVTVTDAIGCVDDDDVFVKVFEGPMYYLPNAFTPNGDGLNDIFRPTPVGIRSTDYFRVFNRYGALMIETREWMKGWDGTLKGKPAAPGTYVWMIKGIDKNGAVVEMKGTVILLR